MAMATHVTEQAHITDTAMLALFKLTSGLMIAASPTGGD